MKHDNKTAPSARGRTRERGQRIHLIGCSGSGKSTLGRALAERLGIGFVDLDDLYWEPGWREVGHEELARRLQGTLSLRQWIIAGNYSRTTEAHVWPKVTELVILDLPLPTLLRRAARRTAQRVITGEPCCNGNRETLWHAMGRDAVLRYTLRVWKSRHERYPTLAGLGALAHAKVTHLQSDAEVAAWFANAALTA
jgi:adenylate kinase family enzyme